MPTKKPRVTFTLDEKQLDRIDKYRFEYKLKNQTQAILSLIEHGLDALSNNNNEPEFHKLEIEHIKKYRELDAHGKEMVNMVLDKESERCESEYMELVARGGKYKVKKADVVEWAKQLDLDDYEEDHDLC